MRTSCDCCERRMRSRASSVDALSGFSMKTCFPASSAAAARSWCVETGVAIATASSSGSSSISSIEVVVRTSACRRSWASRSSGPQIAGPGELRALARDDVSRQVRAPVPQPDDADPNDAIVAHDVAPRPRKTADGVRASSLTSRPSDPVPRVGSVEVERLAESGVRTGRDLPQTRHSGRDEEAVEVVRREHRCLVLQAGPGADERHVAPHDVEELRKLVETRSTQPRTHLRDVVVPRELVEVPLRRSWLSDP